MAAIDRLRLKRDALLAASDWSQLSDAPISAEKKQAYQTYRQALRDLPSNTQDLENPIWPQEPQ